MLKEILIRFQPLSSMNRSNKFAQPRLNFKGIPEHGWSNILYSCARFHRLVPKELVRGCLIRNENKSYSFSISWAYAFKTIRRWTVPFPERIIGLPGSVTRIISLKILANCGASPFASSTCGLPIVNVLSHREGSTDDTHHILFRNAIIIFWSLGLNAYSLDSSMSTPVCVFSRPNIIAPVTYGTEMICPSCWRGTTFSPVTVFVSYKD